MNDKDRAAFQRTVKRLKIHTEKTGSGISYDKARQIVSKHLERSDNKKTRG